MNIGQPIDPKPPPSSSGRAGGLEGAQDGDVPADSSLQAAALDLADRRLAAAVLARADADAVCLQEVFDIESSITFMNIFCAVASAGPTPGIASSRRLVSLDRCQAMIRRSNFRRAFSRRSWTPRAARQARATSGSCSPRTAEKREKPLNKLLACYASFRRCCSCCLSSFANVCMRVRLSPL
jgi:hypothetical protein